ncbi:MAG TPA: VWA domain-containing protein [Pyrinomonadaceae bacterium]|nr:VWA domain-containing protein [Pyrinomonadaceae bacterium]
MFISLSLSSFLLLSSWSVALTQSPQTQTPLPDEVLRISTDLVQTDLVVLDKKGNNVKGLSKDDFELLVDGQRQNISFFDGVDAGSVKEAVQLATAREKSAGGATSAAVGTPSPVASAPGRSFIFFVDDYHLSVEGVQRTSDLLNNFVSKMGDDDRALLMSPSGQIGFLQQLTDHKGALKLAISRIKHQLQSVPFSTTRRPMSIYEALAIEQNQRDMIDYKTKEYIDDMGVDRAPGRNPNTSMQTRQMTAEAAIKSEARNLVAHANQINEALLGTLEYVARGAGTLPGRKLFFLISDGFLIDTRHAKSTERFNRIIDTAARSGVAIYTVDTKGLTAGGIGASQDAFADIAIGINPGPSHQPRTDATTSSLSRDAASRDVLRTLAADTGGRAILNRNDLEGGVSQVLRETASYYVLAWKPSVVEAGKPKFNTLAVTVKGRPELRVLARKGFYTTALLPIPEAAKPAPKDSKGVALKPSEMELRAALTAAFPRRQLGLSSYSTYTNESGTNYKVITFADLSRADATKGEVDFYVTLLDNTGKAVTSVGQKLTVAENSQPSRVTTTLPHTVPPGLYQVRVAARDVQSGRIGSSFQWIELPPFEAGKLTSSNILLAEVTGKAGETPVLDVDRRFARTSSMLIQMFVYNAKPAAAGAPDVSVTLQVLRDGKQVIAAPPQPISSAGVTDSARLPYGVEIPLSGFELGRYTLKVIAHDRTVKTGTSQQINFSIE